MDRINVLDALNALSPEMRRDFNLLRFSLALDGATDEQIITMVIALGYLYQVLSGERKFDRGEAITYLLRLYEALGIHNGAKQDKNHPKTAARD